MQIQIVGIQNGYVVTIIGLYERKGNPLIIYCPNWSQVLLILEKYKPEEESISGGQN